MRAYQLVEDFFADESFQDFVLKKSISSKIYWEDFENKNPELKPLMDQAKEMILLLNPIQINSEIPSLEILKVKKVRLSKIREKYIFYILLLLALFLLASMYYFRPTHIFNPNVNQSVFQSYASSSKIESFLLEDGSKITLKPNSRIELLGDWSVERNVKLIGDAFFDVSQKSDIPMNIETNQGVISILGTSFTVNSSDRYEVILNSGKILWKNDIIGEKILEPDDMLIISNNKMKLKKVNSEDYSLWASDKLSFKDVKLVKVVEILEKSYGLKIEVTKSELLEKSITANIPKNDPELMLQAIAAIYEITLSQKEGKFILE